MRLAVAGVKLVIGWSAVNVLAGMVLIAPGLGAFVFNPA